ncbi:MAG TPA: glycosyltransferase family 4 protein [Bacillota bacterium]|nr:glycosyltransferase family 4 protein [Bacillota bacterium]
MKIAIVSPGSFSVPPVIGSSVEHDIQMVAKQLARDHHVIVYTKKCLEYKRSTKEGKLYYKRFMFNHYDQYVEMVGKHLKKMNPDIVMVENRPSYICRLKSFIPRVAIVLNMHSTVFSSPPTITKEEMVEVSKEVDALITNSEYLRKYFVEKYPFFNMKTFAVHLGINPDPFQKARKKEAAVARIKRELRITERDQVLLFVGRLLKEKGLHLLLDVLPKLTEEFPRLKLIITGSPVYGRNIHTPYVKFLKQKTNWLKNQVLFTNFIKPQHIPYIYQLADIVVIPSLWEEPFGRVNLEAMASTKPIVASDRGGIPELVKHEQNGCIFSIENYRQELYRSIRLLLQSKELREKFGKQGYKMVKDFSWASTAQGYYQVFQGLLTETERVPEEPHQTSGGDGLNEGVNPVCGEGNATPAVFLLSTKDNATSSQ